MEEFDELESKEVLSSDGNLVGKLADFTLEEDWRMEGMEVKIDKDAADELGAEKPLLSSPKMKIALTHVKAVSDKIVLDEPLEELYRYFEEDEFADRIMSIIGLKISDSEGNDIGKVEDLLIDVEEFGKPSLSVTLEKDMLEDLNVKKSFLSKTRVGISMEHVRDIGDVVMLDTTAENLGEIIEKEPVKKI